MYVGMGHTVSGLLTGVLSRADVALWVITMFGLLIFMGVVLPSVWSAKPARRRAAREVLRQGSSFSKGLVPMREQLKGERRTHCADSPCCLAGGYGSLGETEHVGAFRVLGATSAFVGRQGAIRINLSLEALQELLARWPGAGAPVDRCGSTRSPPLSAG